MGKDIETSIWEKTCLSSRTILNFTYGMSKKICVWLIMSNHNQLKMLVPDLSFFSVITTCKEHGDIHWFFPELLFRKCTFFVLLIILLIARRMSGFLLWFCNLYINAYNKNNNHRILQSNWWRTFLRDNSVFMHNINQTFIFQIISNLTPLATLSKDISGSFKNFGCGWVKLAEPNQRY